MTKTYDIASEAIEPTLSYILVRLFFKTKEVADTYGVRSLEYQRQKTNLEYAMNGMRRMVLAIPECVHAHLAIANEFKKIQLELDRLEAEAFHPNP